MNHNRQLSSITLTEFLRCDTLPDMRFFWLLIFLPTLLSCKPVPVLSEGRIRPFQVDADMWLLKTYGSTALPDNSAEELLWSLALQGHQEWDDYPLFLLNHEIQEELGIHKSHASFNQLAPLIASIEQPNANLEELITHINEYQTFSLIDPDPNIPIAQSAYGLKVLPSRRDLGTWLPVNTLAMMRRNMTPYSDDSYQTLSNLYQQLRLNLDPELLASFQELLTEEYKTIANKQVHGLTLPSINQLKAEVFYYRVPWIEIILALYGAALLLLLVNPRLGTGCFIVAWALHSVVLGLRCYILSRPPVANMFETLLYVPWIASTFALALAATRKERGPLIAGASVAALLLLLIRITYPVHELENVQAVLNSRFWLMIHVLMVVGSYGAFILSGLIAHYSLIRRFWTPIPRETRWTLTTLYVGVILLISGTILGGVWAAQSWGRFWDWDPKESWAFISSCLYLAVIHAYRFGKINEVGLALGSIIGLQAITFTWYGVNYILGVGLHSYGFGQGGELTYALFVACELIFVIFCLTMHKKKGNMTSSFLS